jgi:phage-related protein
MPQALPFSDRISQNNTYNDLQANLLDSQLGDGYVQTAPDGINYIWGKYSVEFLPLIQSDMQTLVTALNAGLTDYLTWQPPEAAASQKWKTIKGTLKVTPTSGTYYLVSVQLRQIF